MPDSPEIGGNNYLGSNKPNGAVEQLHKVNTVQVNEHAENPPQGHDTENPVMTDPTTGAKVSAEKLRRATAEMIGPAIERAERAGRNLAHDPLGTTKRAVLTSRELRHETHEINRPKSWKKKFFNSIGGKIIRMGIEMIPVSGDALAIGQAAIGRDTGGNKLDWIERAMYLAGGAIPLWPALPFVEVLKVIRHRTEDTVYVVDKFMKGRNNPEIDNAYVEHSSKTTTEEPRSPQLQKPE